MELTFGEQIKIILKRKNMTIRQLAELVEVQTGKPMSRQNLTQKLNRDNFQEQDMKEVAQALGCTVQISVIDSEKAASPAIQNVPGQSLPEEAASVEEAGIGGEPEKAGLQKKGRRKAGKPSVGRLRAVHPAGALPKPQPSKQEEPAEPAQETPVREARELAELEAAITEQPIPADHEIPAGKETVAEGTDVNADVLKEIEMALLESVRKELEQSGVQEPESQETGDSGETVPEEPEADSLAWARQKPSVWPTLTVPTGSWMSTMPFGEDELLIDAGSPADAEVPLDAGLLMDLPEETELASKRERGPEESPEEEGQPETETLPDAQEGSEAQEKPEAEIAPDVEEEREAEAAPDVEEKSEAEVISDVEEGATAEVTPDVEEQPEAEAAPDVEERAATEIASDAKEEREAEVAPDVEGQPETEGLSDAEINQGPEENVAEGQESPDDLEFFDLADFGGGEISQVSAPYIMKRERSSEKKMLLGKRNTQEKRVLPEKKNLQEKKLLSGRKDLKDKNEEDISFASAPYVISREPEEKAEETPEKEQKEEETKEKKAEEVFQEELPEEDAEGFRAFDILSGSRKGDISSVSAPYVIPREPEKETVQETEREQAEEPVGEWGNEPDEEDSTEEEWPEWSLEEEEEDPPEPALEEKIASWDAAVKRRLENPFVMSLEERKARRMAKEEESARMKKEKKMPVQEKEEVTADRRETEENREAGSRNEKGMEIEGQAEAGNRPEEKRQEESEGQTIVEVENNAAGSEEPERVNNIRGEEEGEPVKKQGPDINPLTGKEYETNTVKHHPTKPDMLLVYDQDEHRWIEQAERAFLNFQINKRALLGKDYEPPVYLDER